MYPADLQPVTENVLPADEIVSVRSARPGRVAIGTCSTPSKIASANTPGVTYYYKSQYDLRPIQYDEGFQVAAGVGYTNETDGVLVTTVQPPAGATLAEVEWYLKATSPQTIIVSVTVPGATAATTMFALPLGVPIATELYAHKEIIDSSVNGPYPAGSTLIAGATTLADQTAGVGGIRFGFKGGTQAPVLLPAPLRAYDSRTHDGPLSSGSTRVVSLAGQLPAGAVGAIVNLTVTHTVLTGFLKAYAAGRPCRRRRRSTGTPAGRRSPTRQPSA